MRQQLALRLKEQSKVQLKCPGCVMESHCLRHLPELLVVDGVVGCWAEWLAIQKRERRLVQPLVLEPL